MGKTEQRKGKRGEYAWAKKVGGERAGHDHDVVGGPLDDWHHEVKNVERLNIWSACEQSEGDAAARAKDKWLVAFTRNARPGERKRWRVALDADLFLELVRKG